MNGGYLARRSRIRSRIIKDRLTGLQRRLLFRFFRCLSNRRRDGGLDFTHIQSICSIRFANFRAWIQIRNRSEEHTSELQSLMRISYAVFCLKKKNNNRNTTSEM